MPASLKHFTTAQIEAFIGGGDDSLIDLLEEAVAQAKRAPDGTAAVQFFVDYEPEEEEEEEEDPDAARDRHEEDCKDSANEPNLDD